MKGFISNVPPAAWIVAAVGAVAAVGFVLYKGSKGVEYVAEGVETVAGALNPFNENNVVNQTYVATTGLAGGALDSVNERLSLWIADTFQNPYTE